MAKECGHYEFRSARHLDLSVPCAWTICRYKRQYYLLGWKLKSLNIHLISLPVDVTASLMAGSGQDSQHPAGTGGGNDTQHPAAMVQGPVSGGNK